MKMLRLAISYSKSLFLHNKTLYIFLTVILVITAFGYMTFFSSTYESTQESTELRISSRLFYMNFNSPPHNANEIQKLLNENEFADILNTKYIFEAEISGEPVRIYGYSNLEKLPAVYVGDGFDENDKRVVVMLPPAHADESAFGSAAPYIREMGIGQEITISGKTYTVIGYYKEDGIAVPYETGVEDFPIESITIEISAETSEADKKLFADYLQTLCPEAEVIAPEPIAQATITRMSLLIYGGLLIGVSSFLTFVFVFVYIINRNMQDYVILRICGCSLKRMCALLVGELSGIYTLSFIFAFVLMRIINLLVGSDRNMYITFNILPLQALAVYAITLLMFILIFMPYAVSSARKSLAAERQSD